MKKGVDALNPALRWVSGLFLGVSLFACQPRDISAEAKGAGCRITSRTETMPENSADLVMADSWTHTLNGVQRYSRPTSVGVIPVEDVLTYNADGYATARRTHYVYSGIAGRIDQFINTSYTYADGRLVKENSDVNGEKSYEYDDAGNVSKLTHVTGLYGETLISTYQAGKQVDYAVIDNTTRQERHPTEFEDGLLVRQYSYDRAYSTRYTYDSQRRCTKVERLSGETVQDYYTYEYTDGKAFFEAIPLPKGWPELTRQQFNYANWPTGLPSRRTVYQPAWPLSAGLYRNIVIDYTYVKNDQGLPLRQEARTTIYSARTPTEVVFSSARPTVEVYTYAGCP